MPHVNESEKIILCSLQAIWHSADAARHSAHSIAENLNLIDTTVHEKDKKLTDYLREVGRLCKNLENVSDQIMGEVTAFKAAE